MAPVRKRAVATIPATATRPRLTWSTLSNSGSLSSCRSRLYASGRPFRVARRPVRLPIRRPALPRASSAMSAFFFCGSMDDPVAYASSRIAKPNSSLVHSTHSSPMRERCTPMSDRTNRYSATWSRSLTASSEFANGAAKPNLAALNPGSTGSDDPARAPAPRGEMSARESASLMRSMSRRRAHACARR